MFAQVYECPKCGDVWKGVELVEMIDIDRDEVWHEPMCVCGHSVTEKMINGKPVWHAWTEEEIDDEHWLDFCEEQDFCDD